MIKPENKNLKKTHGLAVESLVKHHKEKFGCRPKEINQWVVSAMENYAQEMASKIIASRFVGEFEPIKMKEQCAYIKMVLDTIWSECGISDNKKAKTGNINLKEKALISIYTEFVKFSTDVQHKVDEYIDLPPHFSLTTYDSNKQTNK